MGIPSLLQLLGNTFLEFFFSTGEQDGVVGTGRWLEKFENIRSRCSHLVKSTRGLVIFHIKKVWSDGNFLLCSCTESVFC